MFEFSCNTLKIENKNYFSIKNFKKMVTIKNKTIKNLLHKRPPDYLVIYIAAN